MYIWIPKRMGLEICFSSILFPYFQFQYVLLNWLLSKLLSCYFSLDVKVELPQICMLLFCVWICSPLMQFSDISKETTYPLDYVAFYISLMKYVEIWVLWIVHFYWNAAVVCLGVSCICNYFCTAFKFLQNFIYHSC